MSAILHKVKDAASNIAQKAKQSATEHVNKATQQQKYNINSTTTSSSQAESWNLWIKKQIVMYPALSLTAALSVVGVALPAIAYPFVSHGYYAPKPLEPKELIHQHFVAKSIASKQQKRREKIEGKVSDQEKELEETGYYDASLRRKQFHEFAAKERTRFQ